MIFASLSTLDYKERRERAQAWWKGYAGQRVGDPAKLAQALITIADQEKPPRRFVAGTDAVATVKQQASTLRAQSEAYLELSTGLALD
jgi:hypothetical protein